MRAGRLLAIFTALSLLPPVAAHAGAVPVPRPKPAGFHVAKPAEPEKKAPEVKAEAKPEAKAETATAVAREETPPATATPAAVENDATTVKAATKNTLQAGGDDAPAPPPAVDIDEALPLPDYPPFARIAIGKEETYTTEEEDTLLDVARHYGLGYVEIRAANQDIDPWAPAPGTEVLIPTFRLLPRAQQEGVVVNLAEMRMYYFRKPGTPPLTYAIGIGSDGLMTPTGETTVTRKVAGPSWHPTARMLKVKPYLPQSLPAGPSNPLGTHALYLGWPTFLIHGSNKPWAIGRRVSSGCMRMYPEDIIRIYDSVPVGTKVTVVEQPILVAWVEDKLYLEANPSRVQSNALEIEGSFAPKELTDPVKKMIADAAGNAAEGLIDWNTVEKVMRERTGVPVVIAEIEEGREKKKKKARETSKAEVVEKPRYN